ncbi:DUF45 domain-containing protein [Alphaproteobacteria bacterium GH1-50]|uniref:DUF45 domain-containing protein n=1 Tax=Kangsaoukella pontilimi TaxID=2691042 RepID=A0A7C9IEK1_9RHOB|nr:SprT family zinc-dependent metalloprotease [Kangsaoukella pontilimi]MXQ06848.1 DUF45 domain-containing protein [Kangsaoukella pontilimi]
MGRITLQGNPPIDVLVRQSGRARRLSLRVSRLDGRVTLTLPRGVSLDEGRRFAESKSDWIAGNVTARPSEVAVGFGSLLPVEGVHHKIVPGAGRVPRLTEAGLEAPVSGTAGALRAWLVERARARAMARIGGYSAQIGRKPGRLTLRDTRSRWGSCTEAGNIMLSWRLILAPSEVFDYVVAHEVAHLAEMNHSPDFWAAVAAIYPGYAAPRRWLRREGHDLHRYRFD